MSAGYCVYDNCANLVPCADHPEQKQSSAAPNVERKEAVAGGASELPVGPGGAQVKQEEIVSVEVVPLRRMLLKGVANSTHVLVQLKTGQLEKAAPRIPLNLVIVLDRSGSMAGAKLDYAKQAIVNCINSMRSDDLLHLVIYDDNAKVVFQGHTTENKDTSIKKVSAIGTGGSTDISAGLLEGAKILEPKKFPKHSSQIFLFSDGEANKGIQNVPQMEDLVKKLRNEQGIKVDSFGIGASFDSNMMKGIAGAGLGKFYYLQSPAAIPALVNSALNGLLELVGQQAKLTVQGLGSSMIKEVDGFDKSCLVSGIVLGDLEQKNIRRVLLEVEANVSASAEKVVEVMKWGLSYIPIGEQKAVSLSGTVSQEASADQEEVSKQEENNDVKVAVLQSQAAKRGLEVERLVRAGEQKKALDEQQKMIEDLRNCSAWDSTQESAQRMFLAERSRDILQSQGICESAVQNCAFVGYTFCRNDNAYTTANFDDEFLRTPVVDSCSSAAPAPAAFQNFQFCDTANFDDEFLREPVAPAAAAPSPSPSASSSSASSDPFASFTFVPEK